MKLIVSLVLILIFIIALLFSLLNFHLVEINFGLFSFSIPLTVALTFELLVGVVIGYIAAFFKILRLKADFAKLNKQYSKQKPAEE